MTSTYLTRLAFAAILALATAGAAAQAQEPSAAAVGYAKELVSLKGGAGMFDPLIPGVIESVKNMYEPTNPNLGKELGEVAVQLRKDYEPRRADLLTEVSKIYASHFTEQELKDLVAFYKTPLGKKVILEEPVALDQSLKRASAWAKTFSDEVLERFRTEMKKKGHNL
jgi:uncharacterized protein